MNVVESVMTASINNRSLKGFQLLNESLEHLKVLSLEDEFFMCLVWIRLGLLEQDLAHRFDISTSFVGGWIQD